MKKQRSVTSVIACAGLRTAEAVRGSEREYDEKIIRHQLILEIDF